MNFLLYMLGRTRHDPGLRPAPRQLLLAAAAAHACDGRPGDALLAYRTLGQTGKVTPVDLLIRGQLHLMLAHHSAAKRCFTRGAERLLARRAEHAGITESFGDDDPGSEHNIIGQLLTQADGYLQRGRFVRAGELLHQARSTIDILLSAQAGLELANVHRGGGAAINELPDDSGSSTTLVDLAQLSDLCLRLVARTHLAIHVAESLRERQLREDLASWAITAPCVNTLLEAECDRLSTAAIAEPDHAELHCRLGLVARAANRLEVANSAFRQTLRLHPHHVPSAARLAVTLRQLEAPGDQLGVLRRAFNVPAATLKSFAAFAGIAGDLTAFDRAADRLCQSQADEKARITARSNLAFALSELAILDPIRADWREPAAVQ